MSVKKRVETIFNSGIRYYHEDGYSEFYRKSKLPQYKFRKRIPELLRLEGVYDNPSFPDYKIHISCRFNDILRAGDTKHFTSCFRNKGDERIQPFLRCVRNNWAVMFVPDKKSGDFMSRCWIRYDKSNSNWLGDSIRTYHRYGNKLGELDVHSLLNLLISLNPGRRVQIIGGLSDDYLRFS